MCAIHVMRSCVSRAHVFVYGRVCARVRRGCASAYSACLLTHKNTHMHTHMHTHTHTHMYTHMHTHMHTAGPRAPSPRQAPSPRRYSDILIISRAPSPRGAGKYSRDYVCVHIRACHSAHVSVFTYICLHVRKRMHTRTDACTRAHTRKYVYAFTRTRVSITHAYMYASACTHELTRARARTTACIYV